MELIRKGKPALLSILLFFGILGLLSNVFASPASAATPTSADAQTTNCDNVYFLTFPAWYRGLTKTGTCDVKKIADGTAVNSSQDGGLKQVNNSNNEEINITTFLTVLGLNIADILLQLIMYGAAFFLIFAGFKYLTAQGNSNGIVSAKKTITNALVGMGIGLLGSAIVNAVFAYVGASSYDPGTPPAVSSATIITNLLNTAYTAAGIVAVFSLIFAGISYATSAGDPAKAQTAKNTIIYSIVGLAIIILAFTITSFITGRIL